MTDNQDTTRAALRHDGEALPRSAVNAGLDEAADRLLDEVPATALPPAHLVTLTDPDADPIFRIGAQIGRLAARHGDLDRQSIADREPGERATKLAQQEMHKIDARSDFLRDAASYQSASSLPGALAHIVVAGQFINDVREISDLDEDGREARLQAAMRCLYSIGHVLEAATGMSLRAFGGDASMGPWLDQWSAAMAPVGTSLVPEGAKPTISVEPVIGLVEQQLVAMNERAVVLWALYEEAGRMEDENSHNSSNDPARKARHLMGDMAETHARRRWLELLRRAIALPATTPRELGLQARLIAVEMDEWWDNDSDLCDGELACRLLLDRLAAFSGMHRIEQHDTEPAEIRDWLDRPEEHVRTYHPELRK